MRAVVLARHGGFDALQVHERPAPVCGPGTVRIAVHAAGVTFADTMARVGLYPDAPPLPAVLGYEVAGEVVECGPGVRGVAVGDRVMAGTRFGGYAEEVVVPEHDAIPLPGGLSFPEGAAIPVNYSTAWAALVDTAGVRPGERVLVHAAGGGVGIAATQIARAEGAEVWGTASPGKHDEIRAQGVEHAIDYTRRGWDHALPPFDVVLDAIGGASFRRSYRLLRPGGRLVAYGASATMGGERRDLRRAIPAALAMIRGFDLVKQMSDSKTVIGLNMLRLWDDRGTLEPWVTPLRDGLARGALRPVVAAAVPFSRAGDGHRILSERRNIGKVVLVPDGRMG
ncbi:MAG TPA: zinc-binding dehydrogenase [Solirubrobacteraceae bacterium]